jgi:hypothetical protein
MNCPQCGTENRGASNFCRFCGYNLGAREANADSGYVPSVPPPEATDFRNTHPPESYQPPPALPVYTPPMPGDLICPRCHNRSVDKGSTPPWAVILAIVLVPCTFFLSLFFLLVKGPHRCLTCGNAFK